MKNGASVAAFEKEFAAYVGARFAIALNSGTSTLHTALVALGVKPGDKIATTPLTMSATSIAILQAGAVPVYVDVRPDTWIMQDGGPEAKVYLPVALYGLNGPLAGPGIIEDAAQTLRKHSGARFTSYSFQASKILALGEGGMLVTDDETLAEQARQFSSLGYWMKADQPRIDSATLKDPSFMRHHSLGWNYRMNDVTAQLGLDYLAYADDLRRWRRVAAEYYRQAIEGCPWITPQHVPEGWSHDYWTYAIALESKELWKPFTEAIVRHGGEMPYGAWRLTYNEAAFKHLRPRANTLTVEGHPDLSRQQQHGCPIAESLQPRLVQFQTNNLESAEKNAKAVRKAIEDTICTAAERARDIINAQPIPTEGRWIGDENGWHGDATGTPCS